MDIPPDQAKRNARQRLAAAVLRGDIIRPQKCDECGLVPPTGCDGRSTIQGHHDDYSQPLNVRWLCSSCHHKTPPGSCSSELTAYAIAERQSRIEAEAARSATPRDDMRPPGRLLLEVNGQTIDIELRPDSRDVRMWRAYRDGAPWMRAGLERIWRAVQADLARALGRRQWTI